MNSTQLIIARNDFQRGKFIESSLPAAAQFKEWGPIAKTMRSIVMCDPGKGPGKRSTHA